MKTLAGLTACALLAAFALRPTADDCCGGEKEAKKCPVAKTPEECHALMVKAVVAKDGTAFWCLLSLDSRKALLADAQDDKDHVAKDTAAKLGVTEAEFGKMECEAIAIAKLLAGIDDAAKKRVEGEKLENLKVDGKKATAVRESGDDKREVAFVKEGESWFITLLADCAAGDGAKKDEGECEGSDCGDEKDSK